MAKTRTAPSMEANADDLPTTAVKERESVRRIREGNAQGLAAYADDDDAPQKPSDTWEKRYGDLRRHQQKTVSEKDNQIKALQEQVGQLQSIVNQPMPRNKEEFEAWKNKYPEIASFIEIIADERAAQRTTKLESTLSEVETRLHETERQRAFAQLKALVPDIVEIVNSQEWQEWLEQLPVAVQETVTKSENPQEVAKMVEVFKATQEKPTRPSRKEHKEDRTGVLETMTRSSGTGPNNRQQPYKFTISQIKSMTTAEYEKNEAAIEEARRQGMILDDGNRKVYHTDY